MAPLRPSWEICSAQALGARSDQQDQGDVWLSPDGKRILAVLADGAGGHHAGALAARAAVTVAYTLWRQEPPTGADRRFLEKISHAAHEAIRSERSGAASARATWVALLATESEACWVHSGDSRLYHFAGGRLRNRTRDHSVAQLLVDRGKIAPEDIPSHPDRSTLLQSLGGSDYLPVENGSSPLLGQDFFLLCTDGVWNEITDEELLAFTRTSAPKRRSKAHELVAEAARRGRAHADNASLWCIART
jgi:serine/threonine protein phosphatase PrpC